MKIAVLGLSLALTHIAFGLSACPKIDGTFTVGPTQHSTCVNGYQIKTTVKTGKIKYSIVKILCGVNGPEEEYVVGSTDTQSTGTVGQASTSVSCKGTSLVITEKALGVSDSKVYSLNEQGSLVVTHMINAGSDTPKIYPKK